MVGSLVRVNPVGGTFRCRSLCIRPPPNRRSEKACSVNLIKIVREVKSISLLGAMRFKWWAIYTTFMSTIAGSFHSAAAADRSVSGRSLSCSALVAIKINCVKVPCGWSQWRKLTLFRIPKTAPFYFQVPTRRVMGTNSPRKATQVR